MNFKATKKRNKRNTLNFISQIVQLFLFLWSLKLMKPVVEQRYYAFLSSFPEQFFINV